MLILMNVIFKAPVLKILVVLTKLVIIHVNVLRVSQKAKSAQAVSVKILNVLILMNAALKIEDASKSV